MNAPSAAEAVTARPTKAWRSRHRLALGLILIVALAHLAPFRDYLTDDTFIHLQFAKNFISGKGFSFEPDKPTYGDTSPGWVMLLAAAGHLTSGATESPRETASMPVLAVVAKAWGALFLLLSLIVLTRIGRTLGWRPGLVLAAPALLAVHAWSARWALSGMETPLATFMVISALSGVTCALLRGKGTFIAGVLLGLATLARPECWLLVAAGIGSIAYGSGTGRAKRTLAAIAGAIVGGAPWLATAWVWFHRLLPNTSAAKAGAPFDPPLMLAALRASIRIFLSADALPLLIAVLTLALAGPAIWRALPRERRAFWLFLTAWPLLLVALLATGGVQVVSRYLLPAVPFVLLLGVASLQWAVSKLAGRGRAAALVSFLVLYAAGNLYVTFRYSAPHARRHSAGLKGSLGAFGVWARANTPPGTLFAMPDIGAFGFYSERPVLDLFGLVTPAMAPIAVRAGYDAVVEQLLFEGVGRPAYLLDRARTANRLEDTGDPSNPYRFIMARSIPDLGITRPETYVYSLYSVRWEIYDRLRPRLASSGG